MVFSLPRNTMFSGRHVTRRAATAAMGVETEV
jgi:hypothetical protein